MFTGDTSLPPAHFVNFVGDNPITTGGSPFKFVKK
jgi:hypothetical protein